MAENDGGCYAAFVVHGKIVKAFGATCPLTALSIRCPLEPCLSSVFTKQSKSIIRV